MNEVATVHAGPDCSAAEVTSGAFYAQTLLEGVCGYVYGPCTRSEDRVCASGGKHTVRDTLDRRRSDIAATPSAAGTAGAAVAGAASARQASTAAVHRGAAIASACTRTCVDSRVSTMERARLCV